MQGEGVIAVMDARVYRRREGVICRKVAGETFLVPIHGRMADLSELFVLNEVGDLLWQRLDQGLSLDALAALVAEEFEVDEVQALDDVQTFVRSLVDAGLAHESAPEGS